METHALMPFFATSIEGFLILLLIALVSSLSNWLKQRRDRARGVPPPPGPARQPSAGDRPRRGPVVIESEPQKPLDWAEELRRLLEGQAPEEPPAPKPAPPPLQTAPTPAARPPAPAPPRRDPELEPVVAPVLVPAGTHFPRTETESLDSEAQPRFELASMEESTQAYQRGAALQAQAAARMQQAIALTAQATPAAVTLPHARTVSPEVGAVLKQLRHPRAARQVILAGILLGPPKALEG